MANSNTQNFRKLIKMLREFLEFMHNHHPGDCLQRKSPAISVNKGCCSHQAISHQPLQQPQTVYPEGIQDGKEQDTGPR